MRHCHYHYNLIDKESEETEIYCLKILYYPTNNEKHGDLHVHYFFGGGDLLFVFLLKTIVSEITKIRKIEITPDKETMRNEKKIKGLLGEMLEKSGKVTEIVNSSGNQ